ncbi:hypothetical protein K458DRAFT_420511 [Lentithecium fluviatile CBS 122367]|uniref:Uncharacterized protein n=1 Tax=Lentithecium fluviatile CBS 122367 TaxID=1168545 RepID=A0A6G1IUG6_9PLEO|nr:hypothetical protein K458DRAFT_420511 [Lentithecium fluviatile CBS 122367]
MSFIRSTTLRASSFARCARPTRYMRAAELQPWQRALQRRTYASAHGSTAKKSDLPWIVASLSGTAAGLYLVLNQDLGHGEEHGEGHHEKHGEEHTEEEPAEEPKEEEAKSEEKVESNSEEKDDSKDKEESKEKVSSPDQRDEPSPRKEPNSQNETSGKQEGLSNTDTKHPAQIHDDPQKSKKGEGVAETAKVKGTVSTDRPPAENKEERGKAQSDKSK